MWVSGGVLSNLQVDDVLADTGPLAIGAVTLNIFAWTEDNPTLRIEHRNALNTLTLHDLRFSPATAQMQGGFQIQMLMVLLLNERVRVLVEDPGASTSRTQVTIQSLV